MNPRSSKSAAIALGYFGAAVGGVLGYLVTAWVIRLGVYMPLVPGALVGVGFAMGARRPSLPHAIVCGLVGAAAGLYTEWRLLPFALDASLGYFLRNLHQVSPLDLVFIVLGGLLAFWFAMGGSAGLRSRRGSDLS